MKRFGVSLEDNLLEMLDELVEKHGFPNRSQAIRFLIRKSVTEEKWKKNDRVSGCIVLLYDHHRRDLNKKSMDIQHQYQNLILSVQHIHLGHDNCLETITVKGRARELKQLSDLLIGLKGVKFGDLVMSTLG